MVGLQGTDVADFGCLGRRELAAVTKQFERRSWIAVPVWN